MKNAYFKNIAKSYQNSGSPKIKTFKNDPEYFNSQTFDKWTIKQLRTGKYGIDPETGALYKLKKPVKVPQEFLDLTSENPSDTETARRGAALSSLRTAYQNPVMQAPGMIGLGAGAGVALRAAAPGAMRLLNAPMQIGSKVFPAVTPANLMTAAGVAAAPENTARGLRNIEQGNYAQGAADIGTAVLDLYVPEALNTLRPLRRNVDLDIDKLYDIIESSRGNISNQNTEKANQALQDFFDRIKTPEGQRRLKELGITNTKVFDKFYIESDPNTFGEYTPRKGRISINPYLSDFPPTLVARHETEHGVQDAFADSVMDEYRRKKTLEYLFGGLPAEKDYLTDIDKSMADLELLPTPQGPIENFETDEATHRKLIENIISTNYFLEGSRGFEKSPFLAEVQQYMMDTGTLPKKSYKKVTPEMVKKTYTDAKSDKEMGGDELRLFNIMAPTDFNYKLIADNLNKMLAVIPAAATGAATMQEDKTQSKQQGGLTFNNNKNYYNNNNNNSMRTSYFRDIAESMAKDGTLDRMANGSYAKPRTYGNTYYSDMARYFQDSGSPSMEVARRPSQQEFLEMIYDTLPAAWRQMSPQQAWNTFQQLPVPDQNVFARNAGIQWTDIPTMGMGTEGGDRRPGAVSEPQMIREQGLPTSIYQTLQRLRDLPVKADGTFVTEEEFYSMPIEDQKNWVDQAAARSQERVRNFDTENVVYERRTPTTSGYNLGAPGREEEVQPRQLPPSPPRKGTGKGKGKGGGKGRPGSSTPGAKTVTPSTEERRRGISTKELYGTPPKRVLGGPNTIMDFFGNARGGMQYPPRMQDGQLMYYNDIDKAGLGSFFKGVGRTLHDFGRAQLDAIGNTTGLFDLSNEKYKTKFGQKYSGKIDKWNRAIGGIGRTALDFVVPGAGTALNIAGSALNPQGLGAKQQQRDMAKKQMALGASGMAGPNWASNMGNAMSQTSQYNPSGMENAMSAMMPGLSALLPSLLGGAMSPGGSAGGGMFRQGGMPVGLMRHMEFMQLFEEPDNSRGTGPYLVY